MNRESELWQLVQVLYEAAMEPRLWADFLKRYTEIVSAEFSVLQIHDLGGHKSTILEGFGLSSPFTLSYNQHYSKLNIWRERGSHLYVAGRINFDDEFCSRVIFEGSEFYNDYMRYIGGRYTMASPIAREGQSVPTLSAMRADQPFGSEQRDALRLLVPHLRRAWEVFQRLEVLSGGEAILDMLPTGVLFLDGKCKATYWNRTANEIFQANDGVTLRNGILTTVDRKAGIQLRKAIEDAVLPGKVCDPSAITIPRRSLCRGYAALAAPLFGRFTQFNGMIKPAAVVILFDPDRHQPANPELVMQTYRLTRKEAELTVKLTEGKRLEQAADELHIAYQTARTHLRRILSKTETSRQAELVLLIARLPSWAQSSKREEVPHG